MVVQHEELERIDTNKEEEMRLASIENDMIQQVFIEKSHRLNLEQDKRQ